MGAVAQIMPGFIGAEISPLDESLVISQNSLFTFPYQGTGTRTVRLKRVLFQSNNIFGRGTIIIRVECACVHCSHNCAWRGTRLILKLTFPSETRVSEEIFMKRCEDRATGEHAWVLNHLPKIYCSFDIPFRDGTPQQNMKKKFEDAYELRIMRGSIQEELQPLESLTTAKECAQLFIDVVICHHWVCKYPRILHRDISQANLMVREKDGKKYGVLNDWDLAMLLDNQKDGPSSQFRTGTKPYMAHEQQSVRWKGPHLPRHDLESFFYVVLLLASLNSSPNTKIDDPRLDDSELQDWYKQDDGFLFKSKTVIICASAWEPPVTSFFSGFSPWLIRLRERFRRGFFELGDSRIAVTTSEPTAEALKYNENTLCNNLTYKKVIQIMHMFEHEQLEIYSPEWQAKLDIKQ